MDAIDVAVAKTWYPGPGNEQLYRVWNISIADGENPVFRGGAWQDRQFRPPNAPSKPRLMPSDDSVTGFNQTRLSQFEMGVRR